MEIFTKKCVTTNTVLHCALRHKNQHFGRVGARICYESGSHSLKLHITHGLHFPSCTALTHSRPPLHQSHSCHHSLINSDCLTTPAPHSLTHIKAAHKHSPSAKSCFPPGYISERSPIHPAISVFDPGLPDLGTLNLCL